MVVEVKVISGASRNLIKEEGARLKAYVTASPEKGKANEALVALLAAHFRIKKKNIRITKGERSHFKTVEIITS